MDRPEEFGYASGHGTVLAVYPDTWECDIRSADGGILRRALVVGQRLPEMSTQARPQWVRYGHAGATVGRAWCTPIPSRLVGTRLDLAKLVYIEEVLNWRISITRDGVHEIRNDKGPLLQFRIIEQDGVIEVRTPSTSVVLRESDQSITAKCGGNLLADVGGNLSAKVKGNVVVDATGALAGKSAVEVDVEAPIMRIKAQVFIDGGLTVNGNIAAVGTPPNNGNITATGAVTDDTGNTNHHSHS